jgi:hypothetical protein
VSVSDAFTCTVVEPEVIPSVKYFIAVPPEPYVAVTVLDTVNVVASLAVT